MLSMVVFYYARRGVREVARIVPRKRPILRDKCDVMTLTSWWTERRFVKQKKFKIGPKPKYYAISRSKGARIARKKTKRKPCIFICTANAASENDKEDRSRIKEIKFDSDSFAIGIDTFASRCMTNNIDHFVKHTPCGQSQRNKITVADGGNMAVEGIGTMLWKLEDDDGVVHKLKITNALCVPKIEHCLLSPQHVAQALQKKRDSMHASQYAEKCAFVMPGFRKTVNNSKRTNVPRMHSAPGFMHYRASACAMEYKWDYEECEHVCCRAVTPKELEKYEAFTFSKPKISEEFINSEETADAEAKEIKQEHAPPFSEEQKEKSADDQVIEAESDQGELMRWHCRLGHLSFRKLKILAALGILPRRLLNAKTPKCATCVYSSMTKKPWKVKGDANRRNIHPAQKPGDCISVDTMESRTPGFVAQLKGRLTKRRYKYATVFKDHYSDLVYIHLHEENDGESITQAKTAFEACASKHNVKVKHYHADNGRFADNKFISSVKERGQTISFCATCAHHQNGRAEKAIRDLSEKARAVLFQSVNRWPSESSVHLWPYALRYVANVKNHFPDKIDGTSPMDRFAGSNVAPSLRNMHSFACPAYALDTRLQSNKSIPKWQPRSRLGLNLGPSPRHARNVNLILNLQTGTVSPQFHVQYDDFFETVRDAPATPKENVWCKLAGFSTRVIKPEMPLPNETKVQEECIPAAAEIEESSDATNALETTSAMQDLEGDITQIDDAVAPRRSGRTRKMTEAGIQNQEQKDLAFSAYFDAFHEEDYKIQEDMDDPIAFKASADPDTMCYHQAMRAPDKGHFVTAMIKEVEDHVQRKHWELIPISEVPPGTKILDSVWAMKRKRDIMTRKVCKYKARLNVHGGQQEFGVNYFQTCSPVVNWFSIRMIMLLSLLNNWSTKQIDFALAYPQVEIECDLHMKLPHGFETTAGNNKSHVLKLKRNLHGQRQAGKIWYDHLVAGLKKIGYVQSKVDECVFYKGKTIFFCCVDDGVFVGPNENEINESIKALQALKYDIEINGDIDDYLGINFKRCTDGSIKLTQPHLTQQIIDEIKLSDRLVNKETPAAPSKIMRRSENEPKFNNRFHCRRIIGKLNFLERGTRPDIAYAVHQCARFSEDPKVSHGQAIEHIVRYLKETKDEGITLKPGDESFKVYVDSDFCGQWDKLTAEEDASTSKSRTGHVITCAGCPVLWNSKLQTHVALSTAEAEHIALSQALRDTIPIMQLIKEIKEKGFDVKVSSPQVTCKAFEDNEGALELARFPKMRPRTKHINQMYHHFRSHVAKGEIEIFPIDTEVQIGDMFAKPLPKEQFMRLRLKLMGF